MPTPKSKESEKKFVKRCIPYVLREGTAKNGSQAEAMCHSIYKRWKEKNKNVADKLEASEEYPLFLIGASLKSSTELTTKEIDGVKYDVVEAVIAMGDMFYQYIYVSSDVLRKRASAFNNTFNDNSHFGTAYPTGSFSTTENMHFITGFNKKAHFDEEIKGIRATMYISHNAPEYQSWRNVYDICKATNKTMNVSMFVFAKYGMMNKKDLPKGVKVPKGVSDLEGNFVCLDDCKPFAVASCLLGKCNDSDGCGVESYSQDMTCDCDSENSENDEEKRKALIKRLKS